MHGGAPGSGAPRGNKNALKHGRYTREANVSASANWCSNRASCSCRSSSLLHLAGKRYTVYGRNGVISEPEKTVIDCN
jgi:hypothetical protein